MLCVLLVCDDIDVHDSVCDIACGVVTVSMVLVPPFVLVCGVSRVVVLMVLTVLLALVMMACVVLLVVVVVLMLLLSVLVLMSVVSMWLCVVSRCNTCIGVT